jgi:hypothetical protein
MAEAGGDGGKQQQQQQQAAEEDPEEEATPELEWAARLLGVLRSRNPPLMPGTQGPPPSTDDVLQWLRDEGAASALGSPAAIVRSVARAVLAAGAKTPTHLNVMVERYGAALRALADDVSAAGGDGDAALLDAVAAGYGRHPARLVLTVDRLQTAAVVSAAAVVRWVLAWDWLQLGPPARPIRSAAALTVLRGALAAALAAESAVHEEATRQGGAVRDAEAQVAAAAAEVERARERDAAAGAGTRPSARIDFALRAETAAAAKLADARSELERLQGKVDAAAPALHAALLALYSGLAARLAAGPGDGKQGDADAEVARREQLGHARALARWLAVPSQAVAADVAAAYAPGAVPDDLRQAVLGQLGLLSA